MAAVSAPSSSLRCLPSRSAGSVHVSSSTSPPPIVRPPESMLVELGGVDVGAGVNYERCVCSVVPTVCIGAGAGPVVERAVAIRAC